MARWLGFDPRERHLLETIDSRHILFLKDPLAPFLALGVMAVIAAGVLAWSRGKRWF